jgi:uncharacterized membrane protein
MQLPRDRRAVLLTTIAAIIVAIAALLSPSPQAASNSFTVDQIKVISTNLFKSLNGIPAGAPVASVFGGASIVNVVVPL